MPKKAPINSASLKQLEAYFHDVEGPLNRLGWALSRYFRETDDVRLRFIALEKLFKAFASDARPELKKMARKK